MDQLFDLVGFGAIFKNCAFFQLAQLDEWNWDSVFQKVERTSLVNKNFVSTSFT